MRIAFGIYTITFLHKPTDKLSKLLTLVSSRIIFKNWYLIIEKDQSQLTSSFLWKKHLILYKEGH